MKNDTRSERGCENPNIQTEERPKTRAKSANLEHKLQAQCVTWFGQTYPSRIKSLFAYFAETMNPVDGGIKTALGLRSGISDLLFIKDNGELWGIEMKSKGTDHVVEHIVEQAEFLIDWPARGFFCDTFEDFKKIILTGEGGIDPRIVLKNLESVKTKTVLWDSVRE